uniref:Uncharacterized protein n=1 Tax=Glossina austeni TaxID=7395 RepID=A0A1A9V3B5_GLOAU
MVAQRDYRPRFDEHILWSIRDYCRIAAAIVPILAYADARKYISIGRIIAFCYNCLSTNFFWCIALQHWKVRKDATITISLSTLTNSAGWLYFVNSFLVRVSYSMTCE